MTVGVAFITYNAVNHLDKCLPKILNSALKPRVLVVNSSSTDGTVEKARDIGAEVLIVPRNEFNHGVTREVARKYLGTDIVVMMTPDAYAVNNNFLEELIEPLKTGQAALSYARQIPHLGADFFESFSRDFNYPNLSEIELRSIKDVSKYGAKTFFCSDSCAAYMNKVLDEVGGFAETLTAEDYIAAIKILSQGYSLAYVPTSVVYHSHRYTIKDEFKRSFDTGYIRGLNKEIEKITGLTEKAGSKYALIFLKETAKYHFYKLPYSFCTLIAKYLGFKIGVFSTNFPLSLKRKLSAQDFYWK